MAKSVMKGVGKIMIVSPFLDEDRVGIPRLTVLCTGIQSALVQLSARVWTAIVASQVLGPEWT